MSTREATIRPPDPHPFQPVTRVGLADELAQRITALIRSRAYATGERLPSIADMASRFGVGAPTVREALKTLEAHGVVQIRHGSGVYVSQLSDALVISNPAFDGTVSRKLLLDLIAARIPIETTTVAFASHNASATDFAELERLLAVAEANLDDDAVLNDTNLAFHRHIAIASGNAVLEQLLGVLTKFFAREQRLLLDIQNSRVDDHAEHVGILAALKQRQTELAVTRMRSHLEGVEAVLRAWNPDTHPMTHSA